MECQSTWRRRCLLSSSEVTECENIKVDRHSTCAQLETIGENLSENKPQRHLSSLRNAGDPPPCLYPSNHPFIHPHIHPSFNQSINQSIKIYIAPLQDTYSEALPTQAKRKRIVFRRWWN